MTTDLRLIARAAVSAIVVLTACDGGSRLGITVDSYVSVEDGDTSEHHDTRHGRTSACREPGRVLPSARVAAAAP